MFKARHVVAAGMLLGGLAVAAPVDAASGVDNKGACSAGRSEWRLRVQPDNGRLEVRFKVNQHRASTDVWTVVLTQNGAAVFSGERVGQGGDGEFEIRRQVPNVAGRDTFVGTATNQRTGVQCQGRAVI